MHITFHPSSVANIARNCCHNTYETWLQNVTSKTIQEASHDLSEYWYIRYYCFICIYIQPENHVQMHNHGVVCTKIYTCLHRNNKKREKKSLFLLCERGVNSSVDSQVWVSIGVFYTARHVLHLSSVRIFTVLSRGFRMLRLLRAVFLLRIQLLARHPDAIDVFKFHHALGEVWGCDVESLLGDVMHCLVKRDSVVRVVAVDVQMSRKTCQRQGHIGHLIELGLEGHVGNSVGRESSEAVLAWNKAGQCMRFSSDCHCNDVLYTPTELRPVLAVACESDFFSFVFPSPLLFFIRYGVTTFLFFSNTGLMNSSDVLLPYLPVVCS